MTKCEAVKKAVHHEESGIIPFNIRLRWDAAEAYDELLIRDYPCEMAREDRANGKISRLETARLSYGNFMFDAHFPWWDWDYGNMPDVYKDPLEEPDVMPPVYTTKDPSACESMFEHTHYIKERYGVYMSALGWGSNWEKAYFTRGIETMLTDIAAYPEFFERILKFISEKNIEQLEILLKCPYYDGFLLGSDWGTQRDLIFSPDVWRKFIAPYEVPQYNMIHAAGKDVMIHSCGDIVKILPDAVKMGMDILNPVQPECMDIEMLKAEFGDKLTFWGGISTQTVLPYGTPHDVITETERVIKLMSKGGGYITSSSQDIQADVPYENLRALIDTARYYAGM